LKQIEVIFTLNSKETRVSSNPNRTLLEVLRNDLGLTGTKDACGGEGECGACTVILNGKPVNSCLLFIGQVMGYCTPGAVLASKVLLDNNPHPSDQEISDGLSGNLCRCTGYYKMVDAIHLAAERKSND